MTNLVNNAFIRKDNAIEFDYPLEPLISEFDKDGIYALINSNGMSSDNGACLVVTGKQYILALNYQYGKGTHRLATARILSELTGRHLDEKNVFAMSKEMELLPSTITGRLYYEYAHDDDYGRPLYDGMMVIQIGDKKFNSETAEMFLQFYDDYALQIQNVCRKYNLGITLVYSDEKEKLLVKRAKDLDFVKKYILEHIDDNVKDYFEENNISEKIIGVKKNEDGLKR